MLLKRLRQFHEKTLQQYIDQQHSGLEPWKKQVMELHEKSRFIFYYDTCELEKPDGSELMVQGETAKGQLACGGHLYLYDGQGGLLGEGLLMSDPYLKEEKRRGFLRSRKNEFLLKITRLQGRDFMDMEPGEKKKALQIFFRDASLLCDTFFEAPSE